MYVHVAMPNYAFIYFVSFVPLLSCSPYSEAISFTASLTPPTSELSVSPLSGVLLPKSGEGTLFTITYKPKSFNKSINHVLKIEVRKNVKESEIIRLILYL